MQVATMSYYCKEFLPEPSQLDFEGDFDTQVKNLLLRVRLNKNEVNGLCTIFVQLEAALQTTWRGCKVMPFGSIITGLGIKSSDVDCFVEIPQHYEKRATPSVIQARNALRRQPHLFQRLLAITSAKVPIVKLYHVPTDRQCDISFKSLTGVKNSDLLAYLLNIDKRVLFLAVIVKYWAKVHEMTGTNQLANYALTLLVIFYLQQIHILPPIIDLQPADCLLMIDNWNVNFKKIEYKTENTQSLCQLLGGFFSFYSNFDFNINIVSVFLGREIPRSSFKTIEDVPKEYSTYICNVSNNICQPIRTDTEICIQDPFEHCRNCAISVYPRLATTVIAYFHLAAQLYQDLSPEAFFKQIFLKKSVILQQKHNQYFVPGNTHNRHAIPSNKSKISKQKVNSKKSFNSVSNIYAQIKAMQKKKLNPNK